MHLFHQKLEIELLDNHVFYVGLLIFAVLSCFSQDKEGLHNGNRSEWLRVFDFYF